MWESNIKLNAEHYSNYVEKYKIKWFRIPSKVFCALSDIKAQRDHGKFECQIEENNGTYTLHAKTHQTAHGQAHIVKVICKARCVKFKK